MPVLGRAVLHHLVAGLRNTERFEAAGRLTMKKRLISVSLTVEIFASDLPNLTDQDLLNDALIMSEIWLEKQSHDADFPFVNCVINHANFVP